MIRVIGGKAKGKKLLAVPGDTTRPILDRVRTALFDILRPRIADIKILDMFAGTGSVGIEALSQGAAHCTFLDLEAKAIAIIKKNLEVTELSGQALVKNIDAFRFLKHATDSYDLIYVAPPQYKDLWTQAIYMLAERPDLLNEGGLIIAQIDPKEYEALELSGIKEVRQNKYGSTLLVFFERQLAS